MYHELPDPTERVGYMLWQTAHLFERATAEALGPFELTLAQFGALVHIGREPGISGAELARRLLLTPQSVQTALKALADRGLSDRKPHAVHGRVLGNYLTPAGGTMAAEASQVVEAANTRMMRGFEAAEAEQLRALVRRALLGLNPVALDRSSIRST